jgi:signal transduction histidine kinase
LVILILIYYWRITIVERNNRELRKLNAELDSFVYSTSHDLRAPLASIQGLINVAKIESTAEAKDGYMDLMEKSVKKLDTFIKDIINYSRNSRLEVSRDKIDFTEIVNEVFSVLYYHDTNENIRKVINVKQDTPFYTDQRRLFIVLNNLISNAFQYQKQNGEEKLIEVNVDVQTDKASITIKDNGIGIPNESVRRVFHMFYRASNKSAGSGLGLYIVKETLSKLGGQISVDSEEDVGTQFDISIPNSL